MFNEKTANGQLTKAASGSKSHAEMLNQSDAKKSKTKVKLNSNLYTSLTPAGAFYVVANKKVTPQKEFLLNIAIHGHKNKISQEMLLDWSQNNSLTETIKTFYRFQQLGYVQGVVSPQKINIEGRLDEVLDQYMVNLSSTKQAVLADENGLYICSVGYPHEVAEELAAMSVDLIALYKRHQVLINNNLKIASESLALVDAQGRSQLKFIPLHIGEHCFALVLGGIPHLQSDSFTNLVKLLAIKYT